MNETAPSIGEEKNPCEAAPSAREAAYQAALHQAWFDTALEQTKAIFAISSAGVGLSLTLIFGSDDTGPDAWGSIWLIFALVCFAVSAWLCAWVFTVNTKIVSNLIRGEDSEIHEAHSRRLHLSSKLGFALGIVFCVFAAIAHVWL